MRLAFPPGKVVLLPAFLTCALLAQTPPAITALSNEATLPFAQIGAVGNPNIPPGLAQSIAGGALEIRQSVQQRPDGLLRVRHILVAPGAPNPTPAGTQMATLEDYLVRVNDVIRGANPDSLTFVGVVDRESAQSPFGSATGLPFVYSVGYETGTPARFSNVTLVIPGRMTTYILTSTGTLTFGDGTTNPDPDPDVTIGIAENITTVQPEIILNAMATDAQNRTLTYSWRVVSGSGSVLDPTAASTRVQVARLATQTVFEVTVTPEGGTPVTKRVAVTYVGPPA